ncbi:MAG: shikimate dehydrogenase [Candidatus Diapherotrites archaeon]|jgi:shikimate dehydrogenase|uniref:Shikimate dehydrogenase (NADP(+)) n=1 Tax=Candidatus Iainarchaeum sp. TaxID=3101447 RepID=A0A8T5GEU6_9ARCH|nr:shikimate dehydrogenase [Candidatus Diapherotrites archaeon]MBT7241021.1 shikimate dehydrogenase [Candidatus Diapherotrites archaeon]
MKKITVIGYPIGHSLSPVMHNAALVEVGLDKEFIYEKLEVLPEDVPSFIEKIRNREIYGSNVTIPHKKAVHDNVDELSEEAKLVGVANTIYFENKKVCATSTDGIGCLKALQEKGINVNGKKVLILGAGGAARAITFALAQNSAHTIVLNRTIENAKELVMEVNEKVNVNFEFGSIMEIENHLNEVDLCINCTPVGMSGKSEGETLITTKQFVNAKKDLVVMDLVYNPLRTKFLENAKSANLKTVDGLGMLVHQGAVGFKLWTGKDAPIEVMRSALKEHLGL